jgi:hypothetical protein
MDFNQAVVPWGEEAGALEVGMGVDRAQDSGFNFAGSRPEIEQDLWTLTQQVFLKMIQMGDAPKMMTKCAEHLAATYNDHD